MPATHEMFDHFIVKLDGADAPQDLMAALEEVLVETDHRLPAMCSLRILDSEVTWVDSAKLKVGTPLKVEVQAAGESSSVVIFDGEIVAQEPEFGQAGVVMQVRAYDRGHRLHRGRHRRAFVQVTDSDLASQLAGDASLSPQTDSTSEVYEHIYQSNLTNWEFMQERAARIGYVCYVDGSNFCFKSAAASGSEVTLKWGEQLSRFYPRLSTSGQVQTVKVFGWDPTAKAAITGQATSGDLTPQVNVGGAGGSVAQSAFGMSVELAVVDRPVHTQGEADKMAKSLADELSGDFVRAEGLCIGNPAVQAGKKVKIENVGDRFSGTYFVTRATHSYTGDAGYMVRFSVTGRRPDTVTTVVGGDHALRDSRMSGVVVGIVTNNNDPDNMGRVKVKFPWLEEQTESTWARLASPMAGANRGILYMPEVNDEVLVAFEHDDINYPYVIGALWNGSDALPEQTSTVVSSGKVVQRIIRTRVGHIILLDDSDSNASITIVDKTGKNKIVIKSSDNTITIEADGDIALKSQKKVSISGQMGIDLDTPQKVNIKGTQGVAAEGTNVDIKGTAQVTVKGGIINLN